MFHKMLNLIDEVSNLDFETASSCIIQFIDSCENFTSILSQIGVIPESIAHDSKQEKLFSKASDAVLARSFREIGLKSSVMKERGDSADVLAESVFHSYTLVADAKAFRMSRTAKNQKDFKVAALSGWRKDADFAILCAPYFQYPTNVSQIYAQAVDNNVCLLSWEHLLFLIENEIKESERVDLSCLWNSSGVYAQRCVVAEKKNCFIPVIDDIITKLTYTHEEVFSLFLNKCRGCMQNRAKNEIAFWNSEIEKIRGFSKEQAIEELIKTKKIYEKIAQITKYVTGI